MGEKTIHLAVVEVQEGQADVTLEGDIHHIAELCESADIETSLQRELKEWNKERDDLEVEVTAKKGLISIADREEE